jgi:hypothetical protein
MRILTIGAAIATALLPGLAVGQTAPASALAPAENPFGAAAAIGNDTLGTVTGQADLAQVVEARNTGTVTGNTVSGQSQTGTITFDGSSFRDLNGLSLLSANTGNNVAINSSLNVNVAINR